MDRELVEAALFAAVLLGVFTRDVTRADVSAGALSAPLAGDCDVVAAIDDDPPIGELPRVFAAIERALRPDGAFVLVASDPSAAALVALAAANEPAAEGTRAWNAARSWADARRACVVAPPLRAERIRGIVASAAEHRLVLVEPEIAFRAPSLARVRVGNDATSRALVTMSAMAALARPLVFTRAAGAPRHGLAKPKLERVADAWVARGPAWHVRQTTDAVTRAALDVLASAPRSLRVKELLREARARSRATSTDDVRRLAALLVRLAEDGAVRLALRSPE